MAKTLRLLNDAFLQFLIWLRVTGDVTHCQTIKLYVFLRLANKALMHAGCLEPAEKSFSYAEDAISLAVDF